jgi:WD40 repeat protein
MSVRRRGAALAVGVAVTALALGADPPPDARRDAAGKARNIPPDALARLGEERFRHPAVVVALSLSPDGKLLASTDVDGRVRLWDTATGKMRREWPAVTGSAVSFTPDGKALAIGGKGMGVELWDPAEGKKLGALPEAWGQKLAFGADGKALLCANTDKGVVLWDVPTGKEVRRFESTAPSAIAFSRDGKTVAAGGDKRVLLWDAGTGNEVRQISLPDDWVTACSLALSPDGKVLAAAAEGLPNFAVWDVPTGKLIDENDTAGGAVTIDGSGKKLITGGPVFLWHTVRREVVFAMGGANHHATAVAISADGKTVACNSARDERIRLFDAETSEERILAGGHNGPVQAVAVAPDGRLVFTASAHEHTVQVWDAQTWAPVRLLPLRDVVSRNDFGPSSFAVAPDGKTLLAAGHRWETATWRRLPELVDVKLAAYAPDGRTLALSGWVEGVRLVRASDGAVLHKLLTLHDEDGSDTEYQPAAGLAFSPDGKRLAVGVSTPGQGGAPGDTVRLFDAATGKAAGSLRPGNQGPSSLAFSPDGRLLAVSAGVHLPVELWRVADKGKQVRQLTGQEDREGDGSAAPLAFSPDGSLLATGGKGNAVVLWEVASGQAVRVLKGHGRLVRALAFAPDGRWLVSGGDDSFGFVWPVVPPALAGEGRKPWGERTGEELWEALQADAATAYPALWKLAAAPEAAAALLKGRLHPDAADAKELARLAAELGDEQFETRDAATRRLRQLGVLAEPVLRKTLAGRPPLEVRRRIEGLLNDLDAGALDRDVLRDLRAIRALELARAAPAQVLLQELAGGAEGGLRTRAARAALARLHAARKKDPAAPPGP